MDNCKELKMGFKITNNLSTNYNIIPIIIPIIIIIIIIIIVVVVDNIIVIVIITFWPLIHC